MTILHRHFAIAMVVRGPEGLDVSAALAPVAEQLDLTLDVRPIPEGTPPTPPGAQWSLAVYGADRPGLVASIAEAVATAGGNIVDLTSTGCCSSIGWRAEGCFPGRCTGSVEIDAVPAGPAERIGGDHP